MSTEASLVTGVDFVVIATQDFERAVEFYGSVLGLPCSTRYGQREGAEFETGNLTLAVLGPDLLPGAFSANRGPVALHVEDTAAARAALESRGVEFVADTLDSGVCHMDFFRDPDGNALMLHHRYAPRD
jgi:catechol 2,3-dioxygenase-like lactoylglutathione lyase family enzyme